MGNLGEMDPMYVGRPNLGEMPPEDIGLLVQAAQNAVGQSPGEELAGQVAATLQALGMSPGPVAPTPSMGAGIAEMAEPALTPSYAAVPMGVDPRPDVPIGIDRFGADRTEPSVTTMDAPPPGMPPEYAAPPATAAEGQSAADAEFAKQTEAYAKAQDAKFAAEQDHAARLASVTERAAERQLRANENYQAERKLIQAKTDAEVAAGIQELSDLAKKEPNPGRWFDNQSFFGQAMWGLALAFGAAHTAITPGAQNAALAVVRQNIANDVEQQRHRLSQEMAIGKMRLSFTQAKGERNLSDARDDWQREYTRLQALERAWIARETVPGDLDAAAAKQAGLAQIQAWKAERVEQHRQELRQAEEAAAARRFQASQAALARQHAAEQARLNREHEVAQQRERLAVQMALAPVEAKVGFGAGSARNPMGKDGKPMYNVVQSGVGTGTGLVMVGPDDQPIAGDERYPAGTLMTVDADQKKAADEIVAKANSRYTALKQLRDLLSAEGSMLEAIGVGVIDPSLNAKISQLGYEIAKSHDNRITNQDFSQGVSQAMGFDPNGNWLSRGKFALTRQEVLEKIDADLANMPPHVSNSIRPYIEGSIQGQQGAQAVWDPKFLEAPKVQPRSQNQIEGTPNVRAEDRPLTSPKDYRDRAAREVSESERRGQELPEHLPDKVEAIISLTQDKDGKTITLGPKAVKAEVDRVLKDLDKESAKYDWGRGPTPTELSPDAERDMRRIEQTRTIVKQLGFEAHQKAVETLEKFERWSTQTPFLSEETKRKMAKQKFGIRSPRDVDEALERTRGKYDPALAED